MYTYTSRTHTHKNKLAIEIVCHPNAYFSSDEILRLWLYVSDRFSMITDTITKQSYQRLYLNPAWWQYEFKPETARFCKDKQLIKDQFFYKGFYKFFSYHAVQVKCFKNKKNITQNIKQKQNIIIYTHLVCL